MSKKTYSKPPLAFADQLQKLKDRGLEVTDEPREIAYLQKISYHRLLITICQYRSSPTLK